MEQEAAKLLKSVLSLLGISVLAAASRTILSEDRRSFGGFVRGVVLAGFVGTIVALLTQDYGFSPATQGGIVGISAFVADDILTLVLNISGKIKERPGLIIDIFTRRR